MTTYYVYGIEPANGSAGKTDTYRLVGETQDSTIANNLASRYARLYHGTLVTTELKSGSEPAVESNGPA